MLCDEIVNKCSLGRIIVGFDDVQRKVAAAEKFILAPDFALACDGLVENYRELERIAPWCRLPHPLCWFEISQADRKLWEARAEMHYPKEQFPPSRVGFLMEARNKECSRWIVYLLWSLKKTGDLVESHNISDGAVVYDTSESQGELAEYISPEHTGLVRPFRRGISTKHIGELMRSDWSGEIRYVFAMLGLINAKNVTERAPDIYRNLERMNRRRIRDGKHPLAKHTVLSIRAIHRPSLVPGGRKEDWAGEIHGRFVRGHFKKRRSPKSPGGYGIFWWSRHWRGPEKDVGQEPRPYRVTT